jgi:hypothetical protein
MPSCNLASTLPSMTLPTIDLSSTIMYERPVQSCCKANKADPLRGLKLLLQGNNNSPIKGNTLDTTLNKLVGLTMQSHALDIESCCPCGGQHPHKLVRVCALVNSHTPQELHNGTWNTGCVCCESPSPSNEPGSSCQPHQPLE